ncbi:tRNA threonylcarbamoyladenosine dehydratase [Clostridium senegalense]|uniref:tRNA threonylcarbamoyladenosine dehydratase n=1 Tax=Clostridium senegalense TaxID=1465809 RepID=UPI000288BA15|nr:tRNA threonylcarbamoyladenosine dehydratase [Clostridium senegalense]
MPEHSLSRTERLIGVEALNKLTNSTIVIFGIGGVGSFSTEALARSGVGTLILVDNDDISISNINRQIHATFKTVGQSKVETMKERILDINPNCNVITHQTFVTRENIPDIIGENVNYVIDAIDTVTSKIDLIVYCNEKNIPIISSMGTGNKLDPAQFKIADIYKTNVCPLAKVMRRELKRRGIKKTKVLFSEELPVTPLPEEVEDMKDNNDSEKVTIRKRATPASIGFVPPVAGMIIASEVVKDIINDL